MLKEERLGYLLEQTHLQQATLEEVRELKAMIASDETGAVTEAVTAFHAAKSAQQEGTPQWNDVHWQQIMQEVVDADRGAAASSRRRRIGRYVRVAAAMVLLVGGWGLYLLVNKASSDKMVNAISHKEIQPLVTPGKNGAVLTLSDGRQVLLDSLGNGVVATENGTQILFQNGRLLYNAADAEEGPMAYNTIVTPRGRQFTVVLPDGSRVWLNAASSLEYPALFTGGKREVVLTGEAYFEVMADSKAPFIVKNESTEVEVLGTAFNMMCYKDETDAKTTLINGAVLVSRQGEQRVLKPGEQAIAGKNRLHVIQADMEEALAWKNGLFQLKDADVATVMRQISRWYDIDVNYKSEVPQIHMLGFLKREKGIEEAVEILNAFGIKCKLDNRNLIVQ